VNTFLFGEKFEEILTKSTAAQKKLSGVFTGLKKPSSSATTSTKASTQKSFRKGPFLPGEGAKTFSRIAQRGVSFSFLSQNISLSEQ